MEATTTNQWHIDEDERGGYGLCSRCGERVSMQWVFEGKAYEMGWYEPWEDYNVASDGSLVCEWCADDCDDLLPR